MKYTNPIAGGADPFILLHDGKYYLYATNFSDGGFKVQVSDDLVNWSEETVALKKDDVMGNSRFWAPEVIFYKEKFYMIYTAELHFAIAVADSPMGPFTQETKKWAADFSGIDGHLFLDDDGKMYLYYVKYGDGYGLYAAEMNEDITEIKPETETFLCRSSEPWELKDSWYKPNNPILFGVSEGPFVLKNNGKYYLTYSCNDYKNKDYSVGFAVADAPFGPFQKYSGNPILCRDGDIVGTGHHSFTKNKYTGELICVYHRHFSKDEIHPRQTCVDSAAFVTENGNDILKIYGPTANGILK